ncbi:MAG: LytTR family DNA-binding domain-containing protein [Chryseolinea sp.]
MKVLVVEDEVLAAERLVELIRQSDDTISIIDQFDTVEETVNFFTSGQMVDLLFLDVQLADGKCFEVFDKVTVDTPVIFTTAYDQFALQAFKFHSIDYLLKPIQKNDLIRALDKLKRIEARNFCPAIDVESLRIALSEAQSEYKKRFVVRSGNKMQIKPVDDVAYFYAEGKSVYLVTKGENRKCLIDHTLEELDTLLDPHDFFRISRKVLVSMSSIAEVKGNFSARLEVKLMQATAFDMTVSRDRIHRFHEWLDR